MKNKLFLMLALSSFVQLSVAMEKDEPSKPKSEQEQLVEMIQLLPVELQKIIREYYLNQIFDKIHPIAFPKYQNIGILAQNIDNLLRTNKAFANYVKDPKFLELIFKKLGVTKNEDKLEYLFLLGIPGASTAILRTLKELKNEPNYGKILIDFLDLIVSSAEKQNEQLVLAIVRKLYLANILSDSELSPYSLNGVIGALERLQHYNWQNNNKEAIAKILHAIKTEHDIYDQNRAQYD